MGFFNWLFGKRRKKELPSYFPFEPQTEEPAVVSVETLMREARELPIGSVRGHAVAHFKVVIKGSYFLNGKPVSLEEIRKECARLAQLGGVVFYYRENNGEEPAPEVYEAVIAPLVDAIVQARLPMTFAGRDYDPEVKVAEYFLPADAWPSLPDNLRGGA